MNKKAQITVFIILGILLLLGLMALIYLRSTTEKAKTDVEISEAIQLPTWTGEVRSVVEDCITRISIDAFKRIGWHGGYIDPDDFSLTGMIYNTADNPVEADTVSLSTGVSSPIAYWWYMKSPNDCQVCEVSSNDPSMEFIEKQVNRYVNQELAKCLDNFTALKKMGYTVTQAEPDTNTTINLEDITISVKIPLNIEFSGRSATVSDFFVRLDLNLYNIYNAAQQITNYEVTNQFLENITTHLIALTSKPQSSGLPPISWSNQRNAVVWNKKDVRKNLIDNILGSYIFAIRLGNTSNARKLTSSDPTYRGVYDSLYLQFLPEDYKYLDVGMTYNPEWGIYFDITPREGDILKPLTTKTSSGLFNFFPSISNTFYGFFYDISFPVVVEIFDNQSLRSHGEKGYRFMFALEANIRDNKDLKQWNHGRGTLGPANYGGVQLELRQTNTSATPCTMINLSQFRCNTTNQIYSNMTACSNACISTRTQTARPKTTESLFCDMAQRLSGNITIEIKDALTSQPVDEASITFGCGNYRKCPMQSTGADGILATPFPICIGAGLLIVQKDGYMTKTITPISTEPGIKSRRQILLEPIREKQVEAVYINVTNLFRVKRKLYSAEGNSILNDLYAKTFVGLDVKHKGILGELYHATDNEYIQGQILVHASNIEASRDAVKSMEYYNQVDRDIVIDAVFKAREASRFALNLTEQVNIQPSTKDKLVADLAWLDKESQNIQFKDVEFWGSDEVDAFKQKAYSLQGLESVTIVYEKVKESPLEESLPGAMAEYGYKINTGMTLVPGKYNIKLVFKDDKEHVIPQKGSYPKTNYTPALLGGADLNNVTGQWIVPKDALDSSSKIRFYFIKIDDPIELLDTAEVGAIQNYSQRYRQFIEPEFIP